MKKSLHKFFIPSEENDFHPHILHTKRTIFYSIFFTGLKILVVAVALALPAEVFVLPDVLADEQKQIIDLTNKVRAEKGRGPLQVATRLNASSQAKADDMAKNKYFAHTHNKQSVSYWLDRSGYKYEIAGENLAVGFNTASEVVNAWKQSPSHYANLIDSDFVDIGVGLTGGVYKGEPTIFIAQHLAIPAGEKIVDSNNVFTITSNERRISSVSDIQRVLGEKILAVHQSVPVAISSVGSTPVQKYLHAKNSLESVTKIFLVSKWIFLSAFVFFLLALCLKVFIRFERRHPGVILETTFLLILLLVFWKV